MLPKLAEPAPKLKVAVIHENPFDYDPPVITYTPIEEDIIKTLPTGEDKVEQIVVGYQADPPPPLTGTNLEQLRYAAALIEVRTGHKVRVAPKTVQIKKTVVLDGRPGRDTSPIIDGEYGTTQVSHDVEFYEVLTAHATGGPAAYEVTWAWLSGFHNGIEETLRKVTK